MSQAIDGHEADLPWHPGIRRPYPRSPGIRGSQQFSKSSRNPTVRRAATRRLTPSPVKLAALRHDLTVWQPEQIRHADSVAHLRALAPDVMVIVGYGQIIPQSIIDIAPLGIINVHASLLPELRGAAPIQWSIVRGYEKTGVTTMRIDAGLDTGDIALKWETPSIPTKPRRNSRRDWPPRVRIYCFKRSPVSPTRPSPQCRRIIHLPLWRRFSKRKTAASTGQCLPKPFII